MSNRLNYYFRQKVTEAELDLGFTYLEDADQAFVTDHALTGVVEGMLVTQRGAGANLTVDVSTGRAYDKDGARIFFGTTQNVDVSVDEGAASTAVAGVGNSKIISVFAKFMRSLTDPRTDGNSITVYFNEAESFQFVVRQGVEALSPSPPALDGTYILLADMTRAFGQTTIVNADIDTSFANRREEAFKLTNGATRRIQRGRVKDALNDLLGWLNSHIDDTVDAHLASAIGYNGSGNWADATAVVATTVEGALDEVVSDLGATSGATRVGAATNAASYVFGTSSTAVQGQLDDVVNYLDEGTKGHRVQTLSTNTNLADERIVNVDTSGGVVSLTLPAPSNGRTFRIKDSTGSFGTNACTLVRNAAESIEGVAASRVLNAAWGSYVVYSDGTNWFLG